MSFKFLKQIQIPLYLPFVEMFNKFKNLSGEDIFVTPTEVVNFASTQNVCESKQCVCIVQMYTCYFSN